MCGLIVDAIVSDNYPQNVNLFKLLENSKELLSCVPHPNDSGRFLYLVFDFVTSLRLLGIIGSIKKIVTVHSFFPNFEDISNSTFPVRLSRASSQVLVFSMMINLIFNDDKSQLFIAFLLI